MVCDETIGVQILTFLPGILLLQMASLRNNRSPLQTLLGDTNPLLSHTMIPCPDGKARLHQLMIAIKEPKI